VDGLSQMRMEYGEIRRTQASAWMLPSTGSIAGGTMGLQFRADAKLLVVPAFDRPLVDGRVVRWWIARCVVDRSCRHRIDMWWPVAREVRRSEMRIWISTHAWLAPGVV
jgi:hypothetical protein